jgi:hypothetical protein
MGVIELGKSVDALLRGLTHLIHLAFRR